MTRLLFLLFLLASPIQAAPKRLALLVGVSRYPSLAERYQLRGPANDVLQFKELLVGQFSFKDADIVILSEATGGARGDALYPTRANIEREFNALASKAAEGDHVVILLAGHGSQQPEDPRAAGREPEPDGLDETFLPRDAGKWQARAGTVTNAIIDDELGAWLKAIENKKAHVWVTIDACHSGSITRGKSTERARQLDPVTGLGVPQAAINKAITEAARRAPRGDGTRSSVTASGSLRLAGRGGIVVVSACQAHEVTVELDLPEGARDARPRGLLTSCIASVITRARAKGKIPSYRDMLFEVHSLYEEMGRTFPTPVIEGGLADREILGEKEIRSGFRIMLSKDGDTFRINSGALHGLTVGSILSVQPPAGKGDEVLGHVRIATLNTVSSTVVSCAHRTMKVNSRLPEGAICKEILIDAGSLRLKVAVDPLDASGKPTPQEWRKSLLTDLKALKVAQAEVVDAVADADWVLQRKGDETILVLATGIPPGGRAFGPVPRDGKFAEWMGSRMGLIARASSLRKLAAGGGGGVKLRPEFWLGATTADDRRGTTKLAWPDPGMALHAGDRLIVRLHNPNKFRIDVTLLMIDSGHSIGLLWPANEGDSSRIGPGETVFVPPMKLTASTIGREHLVMVAVRARTKEPINFGALAQPGLDQARSTRSREEAMDTPLGRLMARGLFNVGTIRGHSFEQAREYGTLLVPYTLLKSKRPARDR